MAHDKSELRPAKLLELDELTVDYGAGARIGPNSLTVGEGEFVSLLGPSGCGKTTNLRCIAGFVSASSGDIRVRGRSLLRTPPHQRNVGLVFQNYALFPHLSVRNNIAFGPRRKGFAKREIADRVDDMIGRMGLEGLEDRLPTHLSGGQQQRVALGRALVLDPDLLLLDEPLSNLDRKLRQQLRGELRRIHREFRKTLIYVTHDQEEALSLSDRIVVMMDGEIAQTGTPREIYERPASARVADFMGECLILKGRLVEAPADGTGVVETQEGDRWKVALSEQIQVGEAVRIAVLADSIVAQEDMERTANPLSMVVRDNYYAGGVVRVVCEAPDGRDIPVGVQPGSVYATLPPGSKLVCGVPRDATHCFPEQSQ